MYGRRKSVPVRYGPITGYRQFSYGRRLKGSDKAPYSSGFLRCIRNSVGTFQVTPGQFNGFGASFSLAGTAGAGELAALFDSYRITGIRVTVKPRATNFEYRPDADYPLENSPLYMAYDWDDATPPDSGESLLQRSNCRMISTTEPTTFFFRPKAAAQLFASTTSTGYGQVGGNVWIDAANTSVPHYGFKLGQQPGGIPTASKLYYDIFAQIHMEFKSVR